MDDSISIETIDRRQPITDEQKRIIAHLYRTYEGREMADDHWSGLSKWDGYLFILVLEDKYEPKACA